MKQLLNLPFACRSTITLLAWVLLLNPGNLLAADPIPAEKVVLQLSFEQDKSLAEVLSLIEAQSDYAFVYNSSRIDLNQSIPPINENGEIHQIMPRVLRNTGIDFKVIKKQVALFPAESSKSEAHEVSGQVVDKKSGEAMVGVNIVVENTQIGTSTDMDGNFSLQLPEKEAVLIATFLGYKRQRVKVKAGQRVVIQLQEDHEALDEIVVVGYGSSSKKLITGAISSVQSEAIAELPVATLDGALQGQSTGVSIIQNSGTPGAGMSVRIRGTSSITAGSQPLYVVDGIPIITGDKSLVGMSGQGINSLSDINPSEIASISILKDASAAAIYGARASNGVVLITTKRGQSEQTSFSFNAYGGVQQLPKKLDVLDAADYMRYINDRAIQDGGNPIYSEEKIANPAVDTDWLGEVFRTAPIQNYELSASGGSQSTKFYISGSYFDQSGILLGTRYKRINTRINIDHKINERHQLSVSYGMSYSINDRVEGDQSLNGPVPNAMTLPPIFPVYDERGNYDESGPYANPVAIANLASNKANSFRNLGNLAYNWKISKRVSFNTKFGFDLQSLNEHSYDPSTTRQGNKYNGLGIEANTFITKLVNNTTLQYMNSFRDVHNLELLAGFSAEHYEIKDHYTEAVDFPNDRFEYIASAATIRSASTSQSEEALLSYFVRGKYNFDNRYILSANARVDGSSKFGTQNRYGVFPSGSAAWRISEEDFFDSNSTSDLKLRLGVGLTGNDGIPNFRSIGLYGGGANYNEAPGTYPLQLPNPNLKWEKTLQLNAGIDWGLWQDRLAFTADYYHKHTSDLLLNRPIASSAGFSSITSNIGELKNYGVELGINARIIDRAFTWDLNWNNSFNRNEVLKLYKDQPILDIGRGGNSVIVGEAVGVFYGYRALGVDASTGDIVFADLNNDGKITSEDREVTGNPNPLLFGGLGNELKYGAWSLNFLMQYSYGNDILNGSNIYMEAMKGNDNQTIDVNRRWTTPGQVTDMPRATNSDPNKNNRLSSRFVEDGSYLRLRNLNLAYNLSPEAAKKIGMSSMRIYFTGQNLLTFTSYSGMDPEVNYAGDASLALGTDFFTYPQARSYTLGLSIGF